MRDQAVDIGILTITPGVEVQMVKWTKTAGMLHDPTTHKARIKLNGLPFHCWNKEAITDLVSGFGTLLRIAPFFVPGNYENLKILLGCFHPVNIPRNLFGTDDPSSCTVEVLIG